MFITRSLQASALFLSFFTLAEGWGLRQKQDEHLQEQYKNARYPVYQPRGASNNELNEKRQGRLRCPNDQWQAFLDSVPTNRVSVFCNDYLGIPPATTVVEVTPTITVTTSADSTTTTTITTRVLTTTTVVQTATTTIAPLRARAANIFAVGEQLFSSVVANPTAFTPASVLASPTSAKNAQQARAESALANACSCKMVAPSATVTEYYTIPAATSTVGYRVLSIMTVTDTRMFTARTTIIRTSSTSTLSTTFVITKSSRTIQTAKIDSAISSTIRSSTASAGTVSPSSASAGTISSFSASASSASAGTNSSSSASVGTIPPSPSSAGISSEATSVSTGRQASISISPNSSTLISSMAITTGFSSPLASTPVSSAAPTVTAVPFTCPEDDGKHIDQIVDGVRLNYIVMCNTQAQTENRVGSPVGADSETACTARCSLLNAQSGQDTCQTATFRAYTDGRAGGNCTLSGATPEYVEDPGSITVVHTGTYSNGDQCRDYNSTSNSSRLINTSALYASIASAGVAVSMPGLVTQTANGGVFLTSFSTVSTDASGYRHWSWYEISASSSYWQAVYSTSWECTALVTRTIVSQPITSVEVTTTTIINGATTTLIWGTTTSVFTNGGGGLSPPTFVPAVTTDSNGDVTTIFSLATQTSTGGDGIIPPTETPVVGNVTVSGGTLAFSSTGDAGVLPPAPTPSEIVSTIVSSGNSQYTTSGSTYTSNGTGSEGVIPPPSTTNGFTESSGSGNFTISGGTYTAVSTGLDGIITPTGTVGNSSVSTSPPAVVTSAGTLEITISGSTATLQSTGDGGILPPFPFTNTSLGISVAATSGEASFATSSGTFTAYSSGDSGIIPPDSTGSLPFSGNETAATPSPTAGNANVTLSSSTVFAFTTGDSGILPPLPPDNSSITSVTPTPSLEIETSVGVGTVEISTNFSTATTLSTGDNGIIPPSPTNITFIGGTGNITIQASIATTFSTDDNGVLPSIPSVTLSLSFNSTSETPFTNSSSVPTTAVPELSSSTNAPGPPFLNSSTAVADSMTPSVSPTLGLNSSSTGPPFTNSGADRTPFFDSSTSEASSTLLPASITSTPISNSSSTGPPFTNSGADRTPFFNESTSMPSSTLELASVTPSPSLNVSLNSTGPPFTNSGADRTPNLFSSTFWNSSIPATSTTDSVLVSMPTVNATMSSSSIDVVITTTTASVLIPPSSANVTGSFPSSDTFTSMTPSANNSSSPTSTPVVSSDVLLPPNSTTTSSPPPGTPVIPPIFGNFTVPSGSGFSANTVPSATPSAPFGSTMVPPFPTGNSSILQSTPTAFANTTTTLSMCPTAPIMITVTSVETSIQTQISIQISTLTQTVTADAISAASSVLSSSTTPSNPPPSTTSSLSTPATLVSEARRAGQPATQPQIAAACSNPNNVVENSNFTMSSDNSVAPWIVDNPDPTISVGSEQDPNGGTIAQFRSAVVGHTLAIKEPLTLCSGRQYELSSINRQANPMAGCTVQYRIGDHIVYTVTPQTTWLRRSEYFTAGEGVDGASVDLQITASCSGYAGMSVTDMAGFMRIEISAVTVVLYNNQRKKRSISVVKENPVEYAALMWEEEDE